MNSIASQHSRTQTPGAEIREDLLYQALAGGLVCVTGGKFLYA